MTADVVAPEYLPLPAGGWYRRAFTALRAAVRRSLRFRLRCLIFGHEYSFARQPHRLMLRCASCGRETVGWAIGPGTPAVMAAPRPAHARRTAAVDAPIRVGPWTLRRREGRGEARDRQRQRLVLAASRATERSAEHVGRGEPTGERNGARPLVREEHPDRWTDVERRVRAGPRRLS